MNRKSEGQGRLRRRFHKQAVRIVQDYVASLGFDRRLYRQDVEGSIVHAKALARQGLISDSEAELIISGLISIREEIERGEFNFKPECEDIHMSIEDRLFEKIGDVAGKLHTARSRNDQVALDMRLFVKEAITKTVSKIRQLQRVIVGLAEANKTVIMPGYTHLQQAQPVLFSHHLLAYFEMLERDVARFTDCLKRADVLPLGSGALAGVPYLIDREFVAKELGFAQISANSIDAVSDRDFVIEYEAAAAITMMHLSRLAEEIVLWSSSEFSFVDIDEAYASGSSIMPQKKNPDIAELARGKTGRVYGNLIAILTVMKGLPLAYNRDMQEDKEGLFDSVDTLVSTLEVLSGLLSTLKVNSTRMRESMSSYILTTDIADYLVKKGLPFREAHGIVAELTKYAIDVDKALGELSLEEYRRFSSLFDRDVYDITVDTSVKMRNILGGTAPEQVATALIRAKKLVEKDAKK